MKIPQMLFIKKSFFQKNIEMHYFDVIIYLFKKFQLLNKQKNIGIF